MKKIFAILGALSMICTQETEAQGAPGIFKRMYLKANTGNGFFTPGSFTISTQSAFHWFDGANHDSVKSAVGKRGLGAGLRFGLGLGYVKNDFLNIGIDVEYMRGRTIKNHLNTIISEDDHRDVNDEMRYSVLSITPHVIFKALAKPKFYLYNRLGIQMTLPFSVKTSGTVDMANRFVHSNFGFPFEGVYYTGATLTQTSTIKSAWHTEYKVAFGLGLNVAFGINYRINDKFRVFGEVFGNYTALRPLSESNGSSERFYALYQIDSTNFHYEKEDRKATLLANDITFTRSGTAAVSFQTQDLGPDDENYLQTLTSSKATAHKFTMNMAVLGINVGIIYRF